MKTLRLNVLSGIALFGILFFSCRHEPELPPGNPEVCFDNEIMLIINSNCNVPGCHGGSGDAPSLASYEDIRSYVTPGKPVQSKLHEVITAHSNQGGLMPPDPKPRLTSSQIDIISIWILQGANHTTCP